MSILFILIHCTCTVNFMNISIVPYFKVYFSPHSQQGEEVQEICSTDLFKGWNDLLDHIFLYYSAHKLKPSSQGTSLLLSAEVRWVAIRDWAISIMAPYIWMPSLSLETCLHYSFKVVGQNISFFPGTGLRDSVF